MCIQCKFLVLWFNTINRFLFVLLFFLQELLPLEFTKGRLGMRTVL